MVDARLAHRWYFCSNPACRRYIGGCLPSCRGHSSGADHVEMTVDCCIVCSHSKTHVAPEVRQAKVRETIREKYAGMLEPEG